MPKPIPNRPTPCTEPNRVAWTITIGTGLDRHGDPLSPERVDKAVSGWMSAVSRAFGGCTVVEGRGSWIDPEGYVVVEPVRVATIVAPRTVGSADRIHGFATDIGRLLDQHSIMVSNPLGFVQTYAIVGTDRPAKSDPV